MTYEIISTGSSGNAVILNENILIDCGVPWKMLEPYARRIRLVLLTHQHGDHFKPSTVRTLHKQRPALRWGCCEWMARPLLDAGVDKRAIDLYDFQTGVCYGNQFPVCIEAVPLPHNAPNCGYKIFWNEGGQRVFYATDCSTLNGIEAKNYDLYMIERNYSRAEMEERIARKKRAGEYAYEYQAMRNHMSEEQALDWLAENAGPNSRYVFLHQHEERTEQGTP